MNTKFSRVPIQILKKLVLGCKRNIAGRPFGHHENATRNKNRTGRTLPILDGNGEPSETARRGQVQVDEPFEKLGVCARNGETGCSNGQMRSFVVRDIGLMYREFIRHREKAFLEKKVD